MSFLKRPLLYGKCFIATGYMIHSKCISTALIYESVRDITTYIDAARSLR